MANSKILTAEQEHTLRQPIDEYVGGIQKEIDELRKDGTTKVVECQSAIAGIKRDKTLSKGEKESEIAACEKELAKAKAVEAKNKDEISKLIAKAESYLKENFDSKYYNAVKASCEAEKAEALAAHNERMAELDKKHKAALAKIEPMQQGDFEALYEALEGNPVTIRFLDPPLHEFVPTEEEDIKKLADAQGKTVDQIKAIIASLHEFNPMMGHRGCRLAVTYPEIAEMQTRAVLQAAIDVTRECGYNIVPEIMIPLVGSKKELAFVKSIVDETAKKVFEEQGMTLEYHVGTMIEIPRAAVTADEIAEEAEFFSFGTNDLTQMTFGFSRDDAGKFLGAYYDNKIFESDPFARLDTDGVGKLVQMAAKLGRQTRPNLKLGICGEHGGDPSSVMFCHKVGLNYVSCSPFRVPIARLAAAHAAILEKMGK